MNQGWKWAWVAAGLCVSAVSYGNEAQTSDSGAPSSTLPLPPKDPSAAITADPAKLQVEINQFQQQIQQLQAALASLTAKQTDTVNEVTALQAQVKTQNDNLQQEIDKLQAEMIAEVKALQQEIMGPKPTQ